MESRWISVARIIKPHGVKGGLKLELLTDFPERFQKGNKVWVAGEEKEITSVKSLNRGIVMNVNGVHSPEEAEKLRNELVTIPETELKKLPENRFYRHELMEMEVISENGILLGSVTEVQNRGSADMLEIKRTDGHFFLCPMIEEAVLNINREKRTIQISSEYLSDVLPS